LRACEDLHRISTAQGTEKESGEGWNGRTGQEPAPRAEPPL
jgi:hypothetical protein